MALSGRVAIVTGGGTGIGKATAKALAEGGARVAIASRNPSHLEVAKGELQGLGHSVLTILADVRKKEEVQRAVGKVFDTWGTIDILINNAGLSGLNLIDDPNDTRWYDILETNLAGVYLITKETLRVMKDNHGGRVINISSMLRKFGVSGYTGYCASKHGVIGFTRAHTLEVTKRGITVNAICPGWVDTEMVRSGMSQSAAYQRMTVEEFKKTCNGSSPYKEIPRARGGRSVSTLPRLRQGQLSHRPGDQRLWRTNNGVKTWMIASSKLSPRN
jgi:NAD(P)-dependent dehydrogenase (short-subunit alcohol dehydrogenase family)